MTVQKHRSRLESMKRMNETPLSTHIAGLMQKEKVTPTPGGLILEDLLDWARGNLPLTQQGYRMATRVYEAVVAVDDPAAGYRALAEAEPDLMAAQTLRDAAMALMRSLVDLPTAQA